MKILLKFIFNETKLILTNTLLVTLMFLNINLKAAYETKNARLSNGLLLANNMLTVQDEKYFITPGWHTNYNYMNHEAVVTFGIDEEKKKIYSQDFTSFIQLQIKAYNVLGSWVNTIKTFAVNYKAGANYSDLVRFNVGNYPKLEVTIIGVVTKNSANITIPNPAELFVDAEVRATRFYKFPFVNYVPNIAPSVFNYNVITKPCPSGTCPAELEVYWDYVNGAEEYELEWTWINDYNVTSGLEYDFRNNATRITTQQTNYRIPLIYEKGFVLFRMRPIGAVGPNITDRVEGLWSTMSFSSPESGLVSNYPANLKYQITAPNAFSYDQINWAATLTFAEDGKKGSGVSYLDGLLMNRQSQAFLNNESKLIAQQSIYDYQGRPAVSVLPSPVNKTAFDYIPNLNLNGTNQPYSKDDFDKDLSACGPVTAPMNAVSSIGAANYYSPSNPNKIGMQGYLPDAENYPFVQVEYTPDQSGRIISQTLPGIAHKLGSTHETNMFYVNPSQSELSRLFGSEVGNAGNYDKTIVKDANGQLSASYIDMNNKVVATSLLGDKPTGLDGIEDYTNSENLVDDLTAFNKLDEANYELVVSKDVFVESPGSVQTFNYEFTPVDFTDACSPKCFDCIYEVEISIKDACGVELPKISTTPATTYATPITQVVGAPITPANVGVCDAPSLKFQLNPSPISVTFPLIGKYTITKKLKVSNTPINNYVAAYLDGNTCITPLATLLNNNVTNLDLSGCGGDCVSCSTSVSNYVAANPTQLTPTQIADLYADCAQQCETPDPCASLKSGMLNDFIPFAGQYASYNKDAAGNFLTCTDPASIFYIGSGNALTLLNGYQSVVFPIAQYVTLPGTSSAISPAMLTPQQFITYYKPEWAETLLKYHPEYAYLEFCNANKLSDKYDYDMLQVTSYDEACQKGFLKPLTGISTAIACATAPNLDPFFTATGQGNNTNEVVKNYFAVDGPGGANSNINRTYIDFMLYAFNTNFPIGSPPQPITNIYDLARLQASSSSISFGVDPCTKDKEWEIFRGLYLTYKMRIVAQRRIDYVMAKNATLNSYNTGFNGCMQNSGFSPFAPKPASAEQILGSGTFVNTTGFNCTNLNMLPFTFTQPSFLKFHNETFYTFMAYPVSNAVPAVGLPIPSICANLSTNFYNPYGQDFRTCGSSIGDPKQPCSSFNNGVFNNKMARFYQPPFNLNSLVSSFNSALPSPAPGPPSAPPASFPSVSPPAIPPTANYCANTCASYANEWMDKLKNCNPAIDPTSLSFNSSLYNQIKTDLILVCTKGCDENSPFGASSVAPANIGSNSGPGTFNTFQDVLNFYGSNPSPLFNALTDPNCNAGLIGIPKPYGSNYGTSTSNYATLDTCGCNKILKTKYFYNQFISTGTPLPNGVVTVDQLFNYYYGNIITNFADLDCKCTTAWGNTLNNWYTTTQAVPSTNWTPAQQSALVTSPPTYVPSFLSCKKACLPCSTVVSAINAFNSANPSFVPSPNYGTLLTTHLNNTFNYNLSYADYKQFNDDCIAATITNCSNVINLKNKLKAMVNQWLNLYNSSLPLGPFSPPVTINNSNMPAFFNDYLPGSTDDFLSCTGTPGAGNSALPVAIPPPFDGADGLIFSGIIDNTNGNSCTGCSLEFDVFGTSMPSIGQAPLLSANLPVVIDVSFDPSLVSAPLYNMALILEGGGNVQCNFSCLPAITPCNTNLTLCDRDITNAVGVENDCVSSLLNSAYNNAITQYNAQISNLVDAFTKKYKSNCIKNINDEKFDRNYSLREYHYTLYYYNQAGNLVKTVPPKGVTTLAPAAYNSIALHKYATNYSYQSYNAPLSSQAPDENASTEYVYDNIGRIVGSANAKQKAANKCSYTLYDNLGRIIEVGEAAITLSNLKTAVAANTHVTQLMAAVRREVVNTYYDTPLSLAINGSFSGGQQYIRNRVSSVTYEDLADANPLTYRHASHYSYDDHGNVKTMLQDNLALAGLANSRFTLNYQYDLISGNVKQVSYQAIANDRFFHKYEYDDDNRLHRVFTSKDGLIWDNDAKYFYYEHGPLARKELGNKKAHAEDFAYTIQGWIKNVNSNILSPGADMGKDGDASNYSATVANIHNFVGRDAMGYNLNYFNTGMLQDYKAIKTYAVNDINPMADLSNINTGSTGGFDMQVNAPNLFNGNISSMVTCFIDKDPTNSITDGNAFPQIAAYKYDQLHRIKEMRTYRSMNFTSNTWNPLSLYDDSYQSSFTYDKNGNILTHKRNGASNAIKPGSNVIMDDLSYIYNTNGSTLNTNKLIGVNDAASGSAYTNDIKGTSSAVAGNNATFDYDYDEIGNLIKDKKEYISNITWTVDRKVKNVSRDYATMFAEGKNLPEIEYEYDANRQRVAKYEIPHNNSLPYARKSRAEWQVTYYVRDASGNTMCTYKELFTDNGGGIYAYAVLANEFDMYGAQRIGSTKTFASLPIADGTFNNTTNLFSANPPYINSLPNQESHYTGIRNYELSNHLGNVIAVISDRKNGVDTDANTYANYYKPEILETHDYYAFGMEMPGRSIGSDFAYNFNGKRTDKWNGDNGSYLDFGARIHDARLGRWLSRDPNEGKYPGINPYNFVFNNPLIFNDPDGKDGRLKIVENPDGGGTIVYETVVHVYGKDATPEYNKLLQNKFNELLNERTFKDGSGKEWKVQIKVTVSDVNKNVLDTWAQTNNCNESLNISSILQVGDIAIPNPKIIPSKKLKNFNLGDNIQELDRSKNWNFGGGETAFANIGGNGSVVGNGSDDFAGLHEIFHMLGWNHTPGLEGSDVQDIVFTHNSAQYDVFDYHYVEIMKLAFKNNCKEQVYQTVDPATMNPAHFKVYKNTEDVKRLENAAKDLKVKKKQSSNGNKKSSNKSRGAKTRAKF